MTGRPCGLSRDTTAIIVEALENGSKKADAARLAGISPATMRSWCQKGRAGESEAYEDFLIEVERARAQYARTLLDQVMMHATAAQADSWRSALELYKETLGSSRGAERAKAWEEVTGELLDRLRAGLDAATFARVVEVVSNESGETLPDGAGEPARLTSG